VPFLQLLALLRDERCWVMFSGSERISAVGRAPYDDVVPFAQALVAGAPDRILWGTDWPHPNVRHVPDDGDLLDLLSTFVPDEAVRHQILVSNPERLYELR
jgi:predicted TIM-barrel fold metal-dependent hydrolase